MQLFELPWEALIRFKWMLSRSVLQTRSYMHLTLTWRNPFIRYAIERGVRGSSVHMLMTTDDLVLLIERSEALQGWVHTLRISGEDFLCRPTSPAGRSVWTRLLLQLRRTAQAARPFQILERIRISPPEPEPFSSRVDGVGRGLKACLLPTAVVDASCPV